MLQVSHQYLGEHEHATFGDLRGADARKAILIVGVMAAHAFGEGSGVGVSFSGRRGWAQGTLVRVCWDGMHVGPVAMAGSVAPAAGQDGTAHAFGEGFSVGVSFSGRRGWAQGTLVRVCGVNAGCD